MSQDMPVLLTYRNAQLFNLRVNFAALVSDRSCFGAVESPEPVCQASILTASCWRARKRHTEINRNHVVVHYSQHVLAVKAAGKSFMQLNGSKWTVCLAVIYSLAGHVFPG